MPIADLGDVQLNYRIDGPKDGAPLVLCHSLGTSLEIWDDLVALLPSSLRILRYDLRGHGRSSVTPAPYSMGKLIRDAETLLDQLEIRDAVFVGLSIGGMIAQGLAVKRLDQIRALVLSNTAAKIATPAVWEKRMQNVRDAGLEAVSQDTMERWFPKSFRNSAASVRWRDLFVSTPQDGYLGCCAAIAGTDFYTPTAGLRLPTLGIVGTEDGATPPDLVRETVDLIPGAQFALIRRAGHLPCVDQPAAYAQILETFLQETGHIG